MTEVTREEFEILKIEVQKNTKLTQEIHDMLRSFKLIATAAKWFTVVAAAVTTAWHSIKSLWQH